VPEEIDKEFWNESRLVALLKKREEEAFRVLMQQYQDRVYAIAYGITLDREESLDIVQEVFIRVYERIETFRGESRLSTWLQRITVNLCLNWKRRWKRRFRWHHQPIESEEIGQGAEDESRDQRPDILYEKKELVKIFWDSLREIPETARAVFVLREVEGLSYDEIAQALKIRKGTVSSRLFYVRKKLKASLGAHVKETGAP
jgi:RNA polymerase sigma-70 factor (ECF subfamily)